MAKDTSKDALEDSQTVLRATKQVMNLGLPLPNRPGDEGLEWPSNVADLPSEGLAEHLSWCTGWGSYAGWHLARAETNETAYEAQYKITEQQLIVNSEKDYKTVTEMKANISGTKVLTDCKAKALEAKALRKMLAALLDGYEKRYATVSREISRRDSELEGMKRS